MISVVVPVYNDADKIKNLFKSLKDQSYKNFEVIIVDDCSNDNIQEVCKNFGFKVLRNKKNMGPACSRNRGVKHSKGKIVLFTDSDCVLPEDWIEKYVKAFSDPDKFVIQGSVSIPKSNLVGDSVAMLGFPAGGNLGFEKMWPVANDGSTTQLVTCNCGIRREVFKKCGYFDETFPYPFGEDTEYGHRVIQKGFKIYFEPSIKVVHPARANLKSFIKWAYKRGLGGYHLAKHVNLGNVMKLRLWSAKNVLMNAFKLRNGVVIFALFVVYNLAQQYGYIVERVRYKFNKNVH